MYKHLPATAPNTELPASTSKEGKEVESRSADGPTSVEEHWGIAVWADPSCPMCPLWDFLLGDSAAPSQTTPLTSKRSGVSKWKRMSKWKRNPHLLQQQQAPEEKSTKRAPQQAPEEKSIKWAPQQAPEEKSTKWAAQPWVQKFEAKVLAFDTWCSGPLLRERLFVHLEAWGASTVLEQSILYRTGVAAGSAMESQGISSAAGAAVMSLALVAGFGLLGLFVLFRLAKCACRSRKVESERQVTPTNGGAKENNKTNENGETKKKEKDKTKKNAPNSGRKSNGKNAAGAR